MKAIATHDLHPMVAKALVNATFYTDYAKRKRRHSFGCAWMRLL